MDGLTLNVVSAAPPPKRSRKPRPNYALKKNLPDFKPSLKKLDALLHQGRGGGGGARTPFGVLEVALPAPTPLSAPLPGRIEENKGKAKEMPSTLRPPKQEEKKEEEEEKEEEEKEQKEEEKEEEEKGEVSREREGPGEGEALIGDHGQEAEVKQKEDTAARAAKRKLDNAVARKEAAKRARNAPLHRLAGEISVAGEEAMDRSAEEGEGNPEEDSSFISQPLQIKGGGLFATNSFQDLSLAPALVAHLTEHMNKTRPTQVQAATIPHLLEGRDVLVRAETGSGKTLAYSIPIVQHLQSFPERINRQQGTYAIIIAPTRELSVQIFDVLSELLRPFHWIVPSLVVGGEKKKSEKARLRKGVSILVATPGRLLDHLQNTHSFNLRQVQWLILDEADRLLDMGFETSLRHIVRLIDERTREPSLAEMRGDITENQYEPVARRTALISATMTQDVTRLAQGVGAILQNRPIFIDIRTSADVHRNNSQSDNSQIAVPKYLDQNYVVVPCKKRLITLASFLRWQQNNRQGCKIIVFMSCIASVEYHHLLLSQARMPADSSNPATQELPYLLTCKLFKLHGNLSQVDRSNAYASFCRATSGVLLCTDVASRGLDLPAVNWIVQYDPPGEPSEYIHRVGRTARLGHKGRSLLFLMPEEDEYVQFLGTHYGLSLRKVSMVSILKTMPTTASDPIEGALDLQMDLERIVKEDKEKEGVLWEAARDAFCSFVRAYTTHVAGERHIFHVKNLHLGHLAKAFALLEPPSTFGKSQQQKESTSQPTKKKPKAQQPTKKRRFHNDH